MPILRRSYIRILPPKSSKGKWAMLGILVVLLCAAILASIRCGSQNYTMGQIISSLKACDQGDTVWRVVMHVRLPRTLACLLAGCALAVAGVLIQSVLNNAMASPSVIGVNAGAGFFALLAAIVFPEVAGLVSAASFLGALLATLLIYALASRAGLSRTTLVLAGIAVSSMLTAGINTITLLYPDAVIGATGFMLGGFSGVTFSAIQGAIVYLLIGLVMAALLATDLNVLQLGEESAASLGLHIGRTRFLAIVAAALLAGAAVSFAGLLGFVGLLIPHAARRLIGNDNVWLLPASALLGGVFVIFCDLLARMLFAPFELPVGIVMSLLGGPFFLFLLLRHKRSRVYG
ncbi:iron ABC transporter permease [[Clostridium] leptum]|nr:iron ABC transporter permease [[Clostridium] leptum]